MLPIIFTLGSWSVSSFGLFLSLSVILAAFYIWRICKVYDLDEEKAIDLVLITFFGGLVFARIYFIAFHPNFFLFATDSSEIGLYGKTLRVVLITRYPGLSFWGGLFGGVLTLLVFVKRLKLNFWEVADFASVGLMLGVALSSFGCLLGGCQPGQVSSSWFAVSMAGLTGKRFPIQIVETFLFLISFFYLWRSVLKFHFTGKIFALGLVLLGLLKFLLESYRGDQQIIFYPWSLGHAFGLGIFIAGIAVFYFKGNKSVIGDLKTLGKILINPAFRGQCFSRLYKGVYNQKILFKMNFLAWRKAIKLKLNIRSNPSHFD